MNSKGIIEQTPKRVLFAGDPRLGGFVEDGYLDDGKSASLFTGDRRLGAMFDSTNPNANRYMMFALVAIVGYYLFKKR